MSKGSRRKGSGVRRRQTSSLKQHQRTGKTLSPPFMTLPAPMKPVPWLRDTFPDMIWLATLITEHGTAGMRLATEVLDRVSAVLDEPSSPSMPDTFALTGQLTAFDEIPESARPAILEALRRDGLFERAVPWTFARALMKYPEVPGRWLVDGWAGNEQIVGADEPERLLAKVVLDHSHGQSPAATRVKFMVLLAWLKADRLRVAPDIWAEWNRILPRYPDDITEEERSRIEPSIRATFLGLARAGFEGDEAELASLRWARAFWRSNWKLYRCVPESIESQTHPDPEARQAMRDVQAAWRTDLDELSSRFLDVARAVDPDLYAPDKHEVLTGITFRALRDLSVLVRYPALWTTEHGSSYTRGLIEARIVLKWLSHKNDPALYARFKAYGRGRLKLFKLHLEEYRDGLDDPPADLDSYIEYLDAQVNQDIWEEFQEISIEGNFAGVDTRKMADQVGMLTEYRLVFAPASASVHSEWSALDKYALAVCRNPLHRRHRIPRDDVQLVLGPELVDSAIGHASALVDDYVENWPESGNMA